MFTSGTASDYADLLDRLHTFLTAKGASFGLTFSGTGDGTITSHSGGEDSVAETFTITATSPTAFSVVGSVSGSLGTATVGSDFVTDELELLIEAGDTPFVAGDVFQLSTVPPWTSLRKALGCRVTATQGNTGAYAAQNLVDGKNAVSTRYWRVLSPVTVPQDVEIEFFEAETIASYQLAGFMSSYLGNVPEDWTLQYWDGDSWEDLDSRSGETDWAETEIRTYEIDSPVSATRYRLHITGLGGSNLYLGAVRMLRSDGIDAAFSQTIWQGPGNDGNSEVLVGAHLFERQDADYFNMEVAAFDAYAAGSLWREQAGFQGKLYVPLWDDPIPYWFVADGRHVVVVAKISTQYEVAYLGLLDQYFTPEQWPYPMALGGSLALGPTTPSWNDEDWRWSNSSVNHRAFTHSDYQSGAYTDPAWHQMRIRDLDGQWIGCASRANDVDPTFTSRAVIWPWCSGLSELDVNLDGTYALWPVMLNRHVPNTIGILAGVACVTGQGLTSETLIRKGPTNWVALNDVFRTDRDDFFAIALD